MAAKKVDALEERLEGEMNQIKTTVEERMSSMEGQVADLRDMIKKMLEVHNQTTASVARSGEGRSTNSEIRREEKELVNLIQQIQICPDSLSNQLELKFKYSEKSIAALASNAAFEEQVEDNFWMKKLKLNP
ncbi:hypothetical protein M5K25_020996 [Dendrobium thyrsiflorum]|uniref:Uncharacterized protein n=1 Tax=Dendrobium thyrsiflorum TaxID=117978 RepID=A0ABD0UC20_DENTH